MAENTSTRRTIIISVIVAVVFVAVVVGVVVWALGRPDTSLPDPAVLRSNFASAMRKASVEATYPAGAPIQLASVEAAGEHPFSAEFTAEELTALLSAFTYTATLNGSEATLLRANVHTAGAGVLGLDASVKVDANTYSASMEGPIEYRLGRVSSTGATSASAEGLTLNAAQRKQLTTAVVDYVNAYLSAAPGLRIGSVRITAERIIVTGVAPDRLTYP